MSLTVNTSPGVAVPVNGVSRYTMRPFTVTGVSKASPGDGKLARAAARLGIRRVVVNRRRRPIYGAAVALDDADLVGAGVGRGGR